MWCGNRCDGGQESVKKPRTVVRAQRPSGHGSYSSGKMWASGEELENMRWQLDLLFSTFICVWSFTNSYCFLHLIWRSCNFFVLQCFGRVVGRVKMWVLLGRRRVSCTGDFLECRLHTMAAHHAAATHRVWCTKSCLVYSRISVSVCHSSMKLLFLGSLSLLMCLASDMWPYWLNLPSYTPAFPLKDLTVQVPVSSSHVSLGLSSHYYPYGVCQAGFHSSHSFWIGLSNSVTLTPQTVTQ